VGQKTHPLGFRLGIIKTWRSRWFAGRNFAEVLHEDLRLRRYIKERLYHSGVSRIDSCYAMALSATLAANRTSPTRLDVAAVCTLDEVGGKWKVTVMELTVKGVVHGIKNSKFEEIAKTAEQGCPISNTLRNNVEIRLSASLTE
jgi:hypothetical protein